MSLVVAQWPFLPKEQRTPEQNQRWWRECYASTLAEMTLRGTAHSVVVYGGSGSGRSMALQAFEKEEAESLLIVRYPVARWPGERHAWAAGYGHLGQIMACTSMVIKKLITDQPEKLNRLSEVNLEYLRWLIEKYTGERTFRR